jgi:hypothetical protein
VGDCMVEARLQGRQASASLRSVQRRIRRPTGKTLALIRQIERAQHALALLESGATILDVVERSGGHSAVRLRPAVLRTHEARLVGRAGLWVHPVSFGSDGPEALLYRDGLPRCSISSLQSLLKNGDVILAGDALNNVQHRIVA